jgi:hypothetical protein
MSGTSHHRSIFTAEGEAKRQRRSYEQSQWCRLLQQVLELQRTGRRLGPGQYQIDPGLWLKLKVQTEKLEPLLTRELE